MRVSAAGMGTPEFPNLGKHCSVGDCNQIDFLPFTCDRCDHVRFLQLLPLEFFFLCLDTVMLRLLALNWTVAASELVS